MNKNCILILIITLLACTSKKENIVNYVDPFIGTGAHGHTYPGATYPFGMIQLSPDNGKTGWDWVSGYHYSDNTIVGFGHLHLSGTGIGDLSDLLFMPTSSKVNLNFTQKTRDDIPYKSKFHHHSEIAIPGYYKVYLEDPQILVELSASKRAGIHKYTYQKDSMQSVVIDLGYAVNWDAVVASSIEKESKNIISGFRHSKGWAKNQQLFFAAQFSKPIEKIELAKDGIYLKETSTTGIKTSAQLFFSNTDTEKLIVKVAVSSVSIENAKENLKEDKSNLNFKKIQRTTYNEWEKSLSKIEVQTEQKTLKKIFYTALYHTNLSPVIFNDANGQFRRADGKIIKTNKKDIYSTLSLWDTFRAEHPLLTILYPEKVSDMINSMLYYYDEKEVLPVWNLYGNETNTMTGYHSIPVIVEAYLKGIRNFDIHKAYKAMKKTMMGEDRGLNLYKKYDYIPYNKLDESVTITLEFAYDDWCLAQLAKELGKTEDYHYFMKRSQSYKHLFDKETGFMRGKSDDGKLWHTPFDPKYSAHRINADYTEGNAWQHSWFVLHDVEELIKAHGGNDKFTDKLEQLFTESSEITGDKASPDISGLIGQYAHGNEPSHHIAYMYNYAKKPWKTQYWVRNILKTQYTDKPDGLSGNEDCGQMSAWYVFSAIGLYPFNPVSTEYQIGSPLFEKTIIHTSKNKQFVIEAKGTSDENIYIQEAFLNNEKINRTNIKHSEIINGGNLTLIMGKNPNKNWGIEK